MVGVGFGRPLVRVGVRVESQRPARVARPEDQVIEARRVAAGAGAEWEAVDGGRAGAQAVEEHVQAQRRVHDDTGRLMRRGDTRDLRPLPGADRSRCRAAEDRGEARGDRIGEVRVHRVEEGAIADELGQVLVPRGRREDTARRRRDELRVHGGRHEGPSVSRRCRVADGGVDVRVGGVGRRVVTGAAGVGRVRGARRIARR